MIILLNGTEKVNLSTFGMYVGTKKGLSSIYEGTNALITFLDCCEDIEPKNHDVAADFEVDGKWYCFRRLYNGLMAEYSFCQYEWFDLIETSIREKTILRQLSRGEKITVSCRTFEALQRIYESNGKTFPIKQLEVEIV